MADKMPPLPEQDGWGLDMHGVIVSFTGNAEKEAGFNPGCRTPMFRDAKLTAYAEQHAAGLRAELAAERGRNGVLAGLLRGARDVLHTLRDEDEEAHDLIVAFVSRIDAALGPATDDLLTGESK